ncbi:MAG: hypothetical protein HZA50_18675, partial [Planctomycetes bacterium]|nr:hypothetical protein [Planctomycetota bacterium]
MYKEHSQKRHCKHARKTSDNGRIEVMPELDMFKERRKWWLECFSGKDPHSIKWQITGMIQCEAVFRVIHEGWRIAPVTDGEGSQVNRMMSDLIIYGFLTGQMFAVRRLAEAGKLESNSDSHNRDVYSLISLLDDMQAHACL